MTALSFAASHCPWLPEGIHIIARPHAPLFCRAVSDAVELFHVWITPVDTKTSGEGPHGRSGRIRIRRTTATCSRPSPGSDVFDLKTLSTQSRADTDLTRSDPGQGKVRVGIRRFRACTHARRLQDGADRSPCSSSLMALTRAVAGQAHEHRPPAVALKESLRPRTGQWQVDAH